MNNNLRLNVNEHWVVLMAGGLGTRLRPLTAKIPKPLLKVGDKPILETILESFTAQGFKHFFITVNYQADQIKQFFGNGSAWGVKISYLTEKHKLGTAGGLSLLPERPARSLLVMNADILTKVNFQQLLLFHQKQRAIATMCVQEYSVSLPFGVVQIDNQKLLGINEKPVHTCYVNAGIYVLEPDIFAFIPDNKLFNMIDLFSVLINNGLPTAVFPFSDYWIDIGCREALKKARADYAKFFKHIDIKKIAD